jgi:Family of unknown function (DUF6152)
MLDRRRLLASLALTAALPAAARAHHGWEWAGEEGFTLTGTIREARLGNPHGMLTVAAEDGLWEVEIGQPWRNAGAGLTEDMLRPGTEITVEGHRSRDPDERRVKAERVIIAGMLYNLYPDRS